MEILATETIEKNGITYKLDLVGYPENGMSTFNDKWKYDNDGLVKGAGRNFDCTWFTVGRDCAVEQAQQEFERDNSAFDVALNVTASKNTIELIDQNIISGDYNYNENANELLNELKDHFDIQYMEDKATLRINELKKALS